MPVGGFGSQHGEQHVAAAAGQADQCGVMFLPFIAFALVISPAGGIAQSRMGSTGGISHAGPGDQSSLIRSCEEGNGDMLGEPEDGKVLAGHFIAAPLLQGGDGVGAAQRRMSGEEGL